MHLFEGTTADDVWRKAVAEFGSSGNAKQQGSRAGDTRELLGAAFTITDPRQRWIASREPALNPAFAIAEVVWIVSGRSDSSFINYWNPKLPAFAGNAKQYHGAYGFRMRRHFGVDQLERAYSALSQNPHTRQVVLQIWDARIDLPSNDGTPSDADIPCNICSFAKIRDGKLEWTQILRSNDLFLGVPHNFVQFTSLQEILASWLGVEVGSYRHVADCLHVYVRDIDHLDQSTSLQCEHNTDVLRFRKIDSDKWFKELGSRMDKMTGALLTEKKLLALTKNADFPRALHNWMLVVAADCARRRKWVDLSYEFMADCSNPALKQLWDRWFARWWTARQEEDVSPEAVIYAQPFLPLGFA